MLLLKSPITKACCSPGDFTYIFHAIRAGIDTVFWQSEELKWSRAPQVALLTHQIMLNVSPAKQREAKDYRDWLLKLSPRQDIVPCKEGTVQIESEGF